MGLLERALKYKKKLNETGRETLIDRIKGPADSGFIQRTNSETITGHEIDEYVLPDLSEISEVKGNEEIPALPEEDLSLNEQDNSEISEEISQPAAETDSEESNLEEEIILFDDALSGSGWKTETSVKEEELSEYILEEGAPESEGPGKIEELSIAESESDKKPPVEQSDEEDISYQMPEFNDYAILYEILKEFTQVDTVEEIYETVIFSIMGQLGVSSVSIISPSVEDPAKWTMAVSTGIKVPDSEISWEVSSGILELLNNYRGVIDIEDMKSEPGLRDDYFRFISVNARLVTPVVYLDQLYGVILVGEKIDAVGFTPPEIDFLHSLSEAASSAIKAKVSYDTINTELVGLRIEKEILSDVEIFQNSLLSAESFAQLEDIIRRNFYSLGIETYSIFLEEKFSGDFYPSYSEEADNLRLSDSGFRIKRENRLITFLLNKKSSIILENFSESNVIIDTFGKDRIEQMDIFISYPFIISGKLSGFITIFKINPAVEIIDVDIRLQRIVRFIFPYIYRFIEIDPDKNRYSDLSGAFLTRLETELKKAADMNMPVTILSLSVKNYKRFYDRFGKIEMIKMFSIISEIIKSRLYTGDFSIRVDRHKFIIVLPGKDKKYAATFSSILKNEITAGFNTSEFKLLVTFISAIFPDEGNDVFSLLEIID
ncbi:MAG TPA: diguanylate cyclase [Spirochaetota bacterium]|nr:diguanylate cyclase [Spirochaetota bacterium]